MLNWLIFALDQTSYGRSASHSFPWYITSNSQPLQTIGTVPWDMSKELEYANICKVSYIGPMWCPWYMQNSSPTPRLKRIDFLSFCPPYRLRFCAVEKYGNHQWSISLTLVVIDSAQFLLHFNQCCHRCLSHA